MQRKKSFYRILALALILIFTFSLFGGCGQPDAPTPAPAPDPDDPEADELRFDRNIKVGIIDTYTGPPTVYTYDARDGFEMAVQEINDAGGIYGAELEYVTRDEEFAADRALSWARELVIREEVDVLAGLMSSASALAVSEFVREEQVPAIVWMAQSERITGEDGHRYIFNVIPNTRMSGRAAAKYMAEMPYTRYALIGSDFEFGHAIINTFWETMTELKPEAEKVEEIFWPVGEADFAPYISAIRAAQPEVVVAAPGGADQIPLTKAIGATDLTDESLVFLHIGTDHAGLVALGDEAPEGMYGSSPYHYYYPDTPENQAFAEKFYEEHGRYPNFGGFNGYLTANLIAEAYREAATLDTEAFIDALEGLTIDTPVGPVTMRDYDHQLIQPFFIGKTVKDPDKPYLIADEIITIPGEEAIPPVEEIREVRGE